MSDDWLPISTDEYTNRRRVQKLRGNASGTPGRVQQWGRSHGCGVSCGLCNGRGVERDELDCPLFNVAGKVSKAYRHISHATQNELETSLMLSRPPSTHPSIPPVMSCAAQPI
ncbi:hypothetical protein C8Q74DRAFT_1028424 [Fomes fomentarius]|nr:hypothetical protein C8Q74DRAFT_1028424 [Fomes fomentarius]